MSRNHICICIRFGTKDNKRRCFQKQLCVPEKETRIYFYTNTYGFPAHVVQSSTILDAAKNRVRRTGCICDLALHSFVDIV